MRINLQYIAAATRFVVYRLRGDSEPLGIFIIVGVYFEKAPVRILAGMRGFARADGRVFFEV